MNFRQNLLLFVVVCAICFAASCARKEKAVVDLSVEEKVVEVKQDEIKLEETGKAVVTAQQSWQAPPQKMGDNSEVTVMHDGFGNKLEKRYFKGHSRLDYVLVRTAANGRREVIIYGQSGERKSIGGELADRVMTASADEIANTAKIYGTRLDLKNQVIMPETVQTKPQQTSVPMPVTLPQQPEQSQQQTQPPPVTVREKEAKVEEQVRETWEERDSTENPRAKPQKAEVKAGKKEGREDE
ncbi:MAG: hypothetical protein M3384_21450 [Acidobacteriota bacterium]|nr:hypothetical protein [Acidobacteriota bacterium]